MRISSMSRLVILALVGTGLVVSGAPSSQAADPFVAGGRSTRPVAVGAEQADRALARAADLARALNLPGASRRVERLDDKFEHRVYDEVVSVDATGREVAIARFEPNGRVLMAINLGWQAGRGKAIGRQGAAAKGRAIADAAGLGVRGRPVVGASAGAGGWSVAWPRVVDGIPVIGDGVRVLLWSDGSFHGLTRNERPLADAPVRRLPAGVAQAKAEALVAARFPAQAGAFDVTSVELAWVAPNDTWAPERPDAPAAVLRLAWVVRFEARGELAERVRMVEYWVDAGDGSVIGGDVVT